MQHEGFSRSSTFSSDTFCLYRIPVYPLYHYYYILQYYIILGVGKEGSTTTGRPGGSVGTSKPSDVGALV